MWQSYFWADQVDRLQLLDRAIAARNAEPDPVTVERADAAQWLEQALQDFPGSVQPCTTVVMHSLFYQYPPKEVRDRIAAAVAAAGCAR